MTLNAEVSATASPISAGPAGTEAAATAPVDLYRAVHKGLRRAMAATVDALGRADAADPTSVAAALDRLDRLVRLCRSHAATESGHIHAALAERAPALVAAFDADHHDQEAALDLLEAMADAVRTAPEAAARDAALHALYLAAARFVGENFEHMTREETEMMPVLRRYLSEAEIGAIHGAIVGTMPPAKLVDFLGDMIPAMSPAEREGLLGGMKDAMPAEAFAGLAAALIPAIAAQA